MKKLLSNPLTLILILAVLLRLLGINHGFPFIFHPDEPALIRSALDLRFNINPHHFDWPHMYFYINFILYMAFAKFRLILELGQLKSLMPQIIFDDNLIFYLISRTLSALLGALTAIPIFLSSKKLFGYKSAMFAALAVALTPFHIWHSHYALIDVPMLFLFSWSIYFSTLVFLEPKLKWFILSGVFAGFAASVKYNGLFALIFLAWGTFLFYFSNKKTISLTIKLFIGGVLSGVFSVIAFVLGTPFSVLDFDTFKRTDGPRGALWQFVNVGKVEIGEQISQFMDAIVLKLSDNTGYVFLLIFVFAVTFVIYKIYKKEFDENLKKVVFLTLPAVFLIFYVSGFVKNRSHYYFIVYPAIWLISSYFIGLLVEKAKSNYLKAIIVLIIFSMPMAFSIENDVKFMSQDTRVELYTWLKNNIKSDDYIIYDTNEFTQVINKAVTKDNVVKKGFYSLVENPSQGYFIYYKEYDPDITKLPMYLDGHLEEIKLINNKFRNGPKIIVYSIK